MLLGKTICNRCFHPLLNVHSPWIWQKFPRFIPVIPSNSSENLCTCSTFWRPFSLSSLFTRNYEEKRENSGEPWSVHFKGAERGDKKSDADGNRANGKLKEGSRKLEEQVRSLKKKKRGGSTTPNPPKNVKKIGVHGILRTIFRSSKTKELILMEPTDTSADRRVLSPDMQMFAHHLYLKGYLRDANFMSQSTFDLTSFQHPYARGFLKFAAVDFGKDHSEIVKWLSASDLKKVAIFGCPSIDRKTAYASKYLRRFFQINEVKVCQKCPLKKACYHANKPPRKDCSSLNLRTVMSVLIMYALESVPQELVVPEEVKRSVSGLLKDIVNLTQKSTLKPVWDPKYTSASWVMDVLA